MTCKICGNASGNTNHQARDLAFPSDEEFPYFQCSQCDCLQIAEVPSDMGRHYPSGYYSFGTPRSHIGLTGWLKKVRDRAAIFGGPAARALTGLIPNGYMSSLHISGISWTSRILDVGCGSGAALHDLRNLGFVNTHGADPFLKEDIHYQNGLTIRKASVHEIDGQWDVVMMMHAIEHVPDPFATVQSVRRLLADDGCFVMATPVVPCDAWKEYGVYWSGLEAPRHLYILSEKSIGLLAKSAGLRVERVTYDSTEYQFTGSEERKRSVLAGAAPAPAFTKTEIRAYRKRARKLNRRGRGDMATFHLRPVGAA